MFLLLHFIKRKYRALIVPEKRTKRPTQGTEDVKGVHALYLELSAHLAPSAALRGCIRGLWETTRLLSQYIN